MSVAATLAVSGRGLVEEAGQRGGSAWRAGVLGQAAPRQTGEAWALRLRWVMAGAALCEEPRMAEAKEMMRVETGQGG